MPALAIRFTGAAATRVQNNRYAGRAAVGARYAAVEHADQETPVAPCAGVREEARGAGEAAGESRWGARAEPGHPLDAACAARLAAEFRSIPDGVVRRCLADVCACAEHLGVDVTAPGVVERLARERLLALVNSTPPSGAPPARR
ncbi:hypothetical protein AB0K60_00875 [Thermopolyspora sp. NPDC052614]|uniref:hypothetical protein n=1 Tax=Thermopolyspora sp. NPDC052614 TaxID=3155682 RepID=UPI00343024E0